MNIFTVLQITLIVCIICLSIFAYIRHREVEKTINKSKSAFKNRSYTKKNYVPNHR